MPTAPNVLNYHIGKGVVSFKATGETTFRDLGNCPSFTYTPAIEKKIHYSSRFGVKSQDLSRITQVGATVKFVMEEITGENMALFTLSDVTTNTAGDTVLKGLSNTQIEGTLQVIGANDIGQQVDFVGDVSFTPSGDFRTITDTDDYSQLEVTADVLIDEDGDFGTWTIRDTQAEEE